MCYMTIKMIHCTALGRNLLINSCAPRLVVSKWMSQAAKLDSGDDRETSTSVPDDGVNEHNPINCNKSLLLRQHRNMLRETVPYREPESWIHMTEKYQRKLYGRFGAESGVNPRICFKTKEDLKEHEKLNSFTELHTLSEMIEIVKKESDEEQLKIKKREDEICSRLQKLDQWKSDLNAKIAKREADARKAKERKERLIEEVRRHFGFKVDPREDRFKEMLEQKEREDKKKQKEERRKVKEEKTMAKIIQKTSS